MAGILSEVARANGSHELGHGRSTDEVGWLLGRSGDIEIPFFFDLRTHRKRAAHLIIVEWPSEMQKITLLFRRKPRHVCTAPIVGIY